MSLGEAKTHAHWAGLMQRALGGDDASYRQLLSQLATAFRASARVQLARIGRGDGEVEDVVQDALLAVHLKRNTWDPARPLGPWAYAILRHKLLDRARRGRGRVELPIDDDFDIAAPDDGAAEDRGDVERLVGRLGEPQRRIVVAMSIEGRSAAEVANEIHSTEGAVRVALHRALKRLAALYREDDI